MRLFISWSGDRSRALARAMHTWLPLVLGYVDPWMSATDIGAGERWAQTLARQLADTHFGIVCVSPENINSSWLLFESGALAKSLEMSKVVPLLLNLELSDVSGPLAQFQAKKIDRDGMLEVVHSLQSSAEAPISENRVATLFDALWPRLEKDLADIADDAPAQRRTRPQAEVLEGWKSWYPACGRWTPEHTPPRSSPPSGPGAPMKDHPGPGCHQACYAT
jgi:hypothetical protein